MVLSPAPQLRACVYNVPLALDHPLDPLLAKGRNLEMVDNSRSRTVGPMPVRRFIDEFLYLDDMPSLQGFLSSRYAFSSIPEKAETASGIYEPLVCVHTTFPFHASLSVPNRSELSIAQRNIRLDALVLSFSTLLNARLFLVSSGT